MADLGSGDISGWSCWDLGAHFGIYSIGLALRVGPSGQVAAFEPNPASFARLERHRRMNRLGWLKAYQAAVSNTLGTSELYTYGDLGSTSTHLPYPGEAGNPSAKPIAIKTVRLDDEVGAGRLREPQFVKIDVEGHGGAALEGMKGTLSRSKPTIIMAFHSTEEVERSLAVLTPLGYEAQPIVTPQAEAKSMVGGDYLFLPGTSR